MSHSTHQPQDPRPEPHGQYPQQQGQYPQQHGHPSHRPVRNGLGTAALVLGVLGVITGPIPLIFWLGGTFGLLALIMGLVGRGRAKRGEATNKGVTTVGAVLGLLAMGASIVGAVLTFQAVDDAVDEVNRSASASKEPAPESGSDGSDTSDGSNSSDTSDTSGTDKGKKKGKGKAKGASGGSGSGSEALTAGETAAYRNGVKVTVSAPKPFSPSEFAAGHTAGNKAHRVTVTIENTGSEKFEPTLVLTEARAGEDGVAAEQVFDEGIGTGFSGTLLPGKKSTVSHVFSAPASAKILSVEVTPGLLLDASVWELTV
ncbi:DUF4190 domain-containing protein [Streptomyces sp. NPDC001985]|uniref:DUF4190 domain-containing protein n=1 Tax=Streptomyces sp. NPDC001985 TaxID=3154406 RepID=UPI00332DF30F